MLVNLAAMLKIWSYHPENCRGSLLIRKTKLSSISREKVETKTRLLLQEPKKAAGAEKPDSRKSINPPSRKGKVAWHHD